MLDFLCNLGSWLSQNEMSEKKREPGRRYNLYELVTKITFHQFSQILLTKRESLNPHTFKTMEIEFYLWKCGISKRLWTNFKTSILTYSTMYLSTYPFNKQQNIPYLQTLGWIVLKRQQNIDILSLAKEEITVHSRN